MGDELRDLKDDLIVVKEVTSELRGLYQEIDALCRTMYDYERKLMETIDEMSVETMTPEQLLNCIPETTARYKACNKYLESIGLRSSGYYPDTNQRAVQIGLYQDDDDDFEVQYKGLESILPVIKPLTEGFKRIDIFESSLSEFGVYSLRVYADDDYKINFTRYSNSRTIAEFKTLREAMKFIQKNHYYQKRKGSYD
jgi:hypothetical protein